MKHKKFLSILSFISILALSGCAGMPAAPEAEVIPVENTEYTTLAGLTVHNTDERLILRDKKDALSSDGLYYASWSAGGSEKYENSDGETVDLYEAQLYLLLGEFRTFEAAEANKNDWLAAGQTNYDIIEEKEINCNEQAYTLLTYRFTNEENPYSHGVSAFGAHDTYALCVELTCQEGYEEDLGSMLEEFLEGCSFQ